jgi:hypothetical protein
MLIGEAAKVVKHFHYDRSQLRQMDFKYLPHVTRVDAVIFMSQEISDPDYRRPMNVGMPVSQILR